MRSMESTTSNTKSKEIEQRFDTYRKKRKRPIRLTPSCEVAAVISATNMDIIESSSTTPKNTCTTDAVASATASHGFISVIGRRRVMEDAVRIVPGFVAAEHCSGGYDFFAVYDGHGGSVVAYACRDRLHLLLAEELKRGRDGVEKGMDWHELMFSCFMKMDRETGGVGDDGDYNDADGNTVGSTATVVVVGKAEIVVANCGDSRAVLCRGGVAVPLSRDHKPDRPDEKERIEAAGGRVINWNGNRVLGVLATSRSIGDHCMKPFVTSQPEINVYPRTDSDEFVVVASDGLWDVVSNSFACEVVRSCFHGQMKRNLKDEMIKSSCYAAEAAALLAELAMARGSKDNISVIVIQLMKTSSSST